MTLSLLFRLCFGQFQHQFYFLRQTTWNQCMILFNLLFGEQLFNRFVVNECDVQFKIETRMNYLILIVCGEWAQRKYFDNHTKLNVPPNECILFHLVIFFSYIHVLRIYVFQIDWCVLTFWPLVKLFIWIAAVYIYCILLVCRYISGINPVDAFYRWNICILGRTFLVRSVYMYL